jgi:D-inositol-3-phosphate glycosyltransferase
LRIGMLALDPDGHPHVSALSAALVRAGHEVVAYLPKDDTEPPAGVRAERIPVDLGEVADDHRYFSSSVAFGAELAHHLAAAPPDLLHAHDVRSGLAARAAIEANPVPVVQSLPSAGARHCHPPQRPDPVYLDAQRAVARDATALIALSKAQAALMVGGLKKRRDAVTVVPHGVDFEVFSAAGPALQRSPRPRVVAVGGTCLGQQGFGVVVRSMAAVPDAELLICAGPAQDEAQPDAQATSLHELAAKAGAADRFRLVSALAPAERAAAYRSADVVACMPIWAPFGQYALEAMACGRPVVATAAGGLPDIVVDGATGTLVPPDKPRRLAAALRKLVGEPFWRDAYGSAGLDRAQARYSWDQVGADTLAVYEQALGSAAPGPNGPLP